VALAAASACVTGPPPKPRDDIAIIEAGAATIARIDGYPIRTGKHGAFEVRPGGHTVEISAVSVRPDNGIFPINVDVLRTLCLKAKPGRRYRIKQANIDGRLRVFFIDTATGEPPKTPCGPDEDDD
jgi:hypothetical protein